MNNTVMELFRGDIGDELLLAVERQLKDAKYRLKRQRELGGGTSAAEKALQKHEHRVWCLEKAYERLCEELAE